MECIYAQEEISGMNNKERRLSERRVRQRRTSKRDSRYNGLERRSSTDRRITIVNRQKKEVTDRRSID